MKEKIFGKYFGMFAVGVLLIAVYKTFDNIGELFLGVRYVVGVIAPVIVAFAIAFLLYPLCCRAEGLIGKCKFKPVARAKRLLSVLLTYVIIIGILITLPSLLTPYISKSINELTTQFPSILKRLAFFLDSFDISSERILNMFSLQKLLDSLDFDSINKYASNIIGAGSAVVSAFLSVIMSMYILIDRSSFKRGAVRIARLYIKQPVRETLSKYGELSVNFIYKYFFCQLIDAGVIIVLSSVLLALMRVEYSVVLGIMMGVMNLIPYFGAIVACVIITVITVLTSSLSKGVWVLIALIVLQQLDANLIQPAIVKENLSVKPFWVLVGILVGGAFFGIVGILLAVPVVAILQTILDDILERREISHCDVPQ